MAGYVLKIIMENTHPPVWRRVMVPERITFADLHQIIQILFDWDDDHMHGFFIPSAQIIIDPDEDGGIWGEHYQEDETLIDPFIRSYKWIRYTYDFGDDWRHKIQIEKTDEAYEGRSAVLLKAKGDNFEEDSGGVWMAEVSERYAFDKERTEKRLAAMEFPVNSELEEVVLLKDVMHQLQDMYQSMEENFEQFPRNLKEWADETVKRTLSPVGEKVWSWRSFAESRKENLYLVKGQKNNRELLSDLGEAEIKDYCKYLQIQQIEKESNEEKIAAISQTLLEHPEYLLYVLDERQFAELKKWAEYPEGPADGELPGKGMIMKVLALGQGDFQQEENKWSLSFASDIQDFIGKISEKKKRETYQKLEQFDKRLSDLIVIYCVLELESLYEIYARLYDKNTEKKDFFRMLYWHARFNSFVITGYKPDGTGYVCSRQIDVEKVIEKEEVYAKDLPYAFYSRKEIARLADDLSNRSDWVDVLFTTLHDQMGLEIHDSQEYLIGLITDIFSGSTLNELMERLESETKTKWTVELYCNLWTVLTGLMLELELPMLRGRSRLVYGAEQNVSPWTLGMTENQQSWENTKKCHMYEFPPEIQEWMASASEYGADEAMEQLLQYKEENHICSEEFLYLLAQECIDGNQISQAKQLISELKRSSSAGKKAGKDLEKYQHDAMEYSNKNFELWEHAWEENNTFFRDDRDMTVNKPYVRETAKIGRNDPCPCGSGKKYKKCCGK